MKLDNDAKKKLLDGLERVYNGYVALDCSKTVKLFDGKSLSEVAHEMITSGKAQKNFRVGQLNYVIGLERNQNNTYSIYIDPTQTSQVMTFDDIENPEQAEQVVALLASQSIELDPKQPHPCITVNNHDGSYPIEIGGDKIPLYRTHLVTLHKIRERLMAGEDISNLLVALATGSGKTFVQALWLACLHSSGMKGFFGVPGKLEEQFLKDLGRLLPVRFIEEKVGVLDDVSATEGFLGQDKDIVVGDACRALDEHFEQLDRSNPQEVMLSFDEQHLLMRVERRRLRLIDLSERFLSCFLTATPNEETYHLCGKHPVATMSNKQKEQANQGRIPRIKTMHAKSASDKNASTQGFFKRLQRGFNIFLSDAIQKQPTSAAIQVMEDLPFVTQVVDGKTQRAVRRKMLFLVDDPDSLINVCHRLKEPYSREVYDNGNLYSREAIGEVLHISDVDAALYNEEMRARGRGARAQQVMGTHLKATIYHNMIDYILTDVMGMDLLELNQYRHEHPEIYRLHVSLKLGLLRPHMLSEDHKQLLTDNQIDYETITAADCSKAHFQILLAQKIDAQGADQISTLLEAMAKNLQMEDLLINDPADHDEFMNALLNRAEATRQFETYVNDHLVLCMMDDMGSKDLVIEADSQGKPRPFWGLRKETYDLYDASGMKSDQAKPRPLKPIEALNPDAQEARFSPNYADITESQADQYFKLGFVGAYISNRKTEGFSDVNLHTVVAVCNESGQRLNGPDKLLQGLGRNRGLDETIEPLFVHALGHGQSSAFSLNNLDKEDYYKQYFKGMRSFRKDYLKLLGDRLAQDIISEYHDNVDADGSFDTKRYRRKVKKMIREDLREINALYNHKIKISRRQLSKVLAQANKQLNRHIQHVEKPNRLSGLVRFIGHMATAVASVYTWFSQRAPKSALRKAVNKSTRLADKIYHKILSKTSMKQLIAKRFVSAEILSMLGRQRAIIQAIVERNPKTYLKDDLKKQAEAHENNAIKPMLLKFISDDYYSQARQALDTHPDLLGFVRKNQHLFERLQEDDIQEQAVKKILVRLFRQMEPTMDIEASHIIDVIHLSQSYQEKFRAGPKAMLDAETQDCIAHGISEDFIERLKLNMMPLLMPEDQEKLREGLTIEVGQQFCKAMLEGHATFLRGEAGGIDIEDQKAVFDLFNRHLGDNAIQNPEVLIEAYQAGMSELQQQLEDSPVLSMNEDKLNQLKAIYKNKIIPAMINLCPYRERQGIYQNITDDKIKSFMLNHSVKLQEMHEQGKPHEEIANFALSELTGEAITSAQSPELVEGQVAQGMQEAFSAHQTASVSNVVNVVKSGFWGVVGLIKRDKSFVEGFQGHYITNLVQDDRFLTSFSTLIPWEKYQSLKDKIKDNPDIEGAVARNLVALGDEVHNPARMVQAVEQAVGLGLKFVGESADSAMQDMTQMLALKESTPSALLKQEVIEQLSKPTKATLIPVLAKYISDDKRRSQFIEHCQAIPDEKLFDFIVLNEKQLSGMDLDDFEGMKLSLLAVLNGLNELGPEASKLPAFEAIHLRSLTEFVERQLNTLQDMVEIKVINEYLRSDQFLKVVELAYPEEDLQKIAAVLNDDEQRNRLVLKIKWSEEAINNLDDLFDRIIEVRQLDRRLNDSVSFMETLLSGADSLDNLDKEALNQLIHDKLIRQLEHPLIKEQFSIMLGTFEQEELQVLLNAIYYTSNPPVDAARLVRFNQWLQQGNTQAIADRFLNTNDANFEQWPLIQVFKVVTEIHEEMMKSHCHFNQHDMKGRDSNLVKPKLHQELSQSVQPIIGGIAYFAAQISYLRGLQNAFPGANALHQVHHADEVRHIRRIRDNVLEPVRKKTGRSVFVNWLLGKINSVKKALRSVFTREKIDEHRQQEQADKKDAKAFVGSMMKLRRLNQSDAKKPDCPLVLQL